MKKLNDFLDASKKEFQEMDDIRESLKDLTKKVAEDLNIEKKFLSKAARIAYKQDLLSKQEEMDTVVDILNVTGNA
jgi:hypothetical protein